MENVFAKEFYVAKVFSLGMEKNVRKRKNVMQGEQYQSVYLENVAAKLVGQVQGAKPIHSLLPLLPVRVLSQYMLCFIQFIYIHTVPKCEPKGTRYRMSAGKCVCKNVWYGESCNKSKFSFTISRKLDLCLNSCSFHQSQIVMLKEQALSVQLENVAAKLVGQGQGAKTNHPLLALLPVSIFFFASINL